MTPTLTVSFSRIRGEPWEGQVVCRFGELTCSHLTVQERLTPRERQELRWYVEEFLNLPEGGNLLRAAKVEALLSTFGLQAWTDLACEATHAWIEAVTQEGSGTLNLTADTPTDDLALRSPWELMRLGRDDATLLSMVGVTFVRQVAVDGAPSPAPQSPELFTTAPLEAKTGLRVLVIVCRPEEAGFLDPRYTPAAILEAVHERPDVTVDFCRPSTVTALRRTLRRAATEGKPYHVVHFDGHGTTLTDEEGTAALCFEDADGRLDLVRADAVGQALSGFQIRLLVLEACRTATPSTRQETLASAVIREGVGTVVAMGYAVHVDLTRVLMAAFYAAIGDGRSLGEAIALARQRAHRRSLRRIGMGPDAEKRPLQDWFVPQLYQGSTDPVLVPRIPDAMPPRPAPILLGLPDPPRAGFHGRGWQIHRLEQTLCRLKIVMLYGLPGVGKTALAGEAARWWVRNGMFPDGAIFVSLREHSTPNSVANTVGEALEGEAFRGHPDPQRRVVELLATRRMLVIWDDFEQIMPGRQGGRPTPPGFVDMAAAWTQGASRLLVTSRAQRVHPVQPTPIFFLTGLADSEALSLLRALARSSEAARREPFDTEVVALEQLVRSVMGEPLALELIGPALRTTTATAVVADLGAFLSRSEQEHSEQGNRSIRASLRRPLETLSERARRVLPAVSLLAGGTYEQTLFELLDGPKEEATTAVFELADAGLVTFEGNFATPHPLLPLLPDFPSDAALDERFVRVIKRLCMEQLYGALMGPQAPDALRVLSRIELSVHRAFTRAVRLGLKQEAAAIATTLALYLERVHRRGEARQLLADLERRLPGRGAGSDEAEIESIRQNAFEDPAAACRRLRRMVAQLGNTGGEHDTTAAQVHALLALSQIQVDAMQEPMAALATLDEAEALSIQHSARWKPLVAANYRGVLLGERANTLRVLGRTDEALAAAHEAFNIADAAKDASGMGRGAGRIALTLHTAERPEEAHSWYLKAMQLAQEAADGGGLEFIYKGMGDLALSRGQADEAYRHLITALNGYRMTGDRSQTAAVLHSLSNVDLRRGNWDAVLSWTDQVQALGEELHNSGVRAGAHYNRSVALANLGIAAHGAAERTRLLRAAVDAAGKALGLFEETGQAREVASTHRALADYLRRLGEWEGAATHARAALDQQVQLGVADRSSTIDLLDAVEHHQLDAPPVSDQVLTEALDLALQVRLVVSLGVAVQEALASLSPGFLSALDSQAPWLGAYFHAIAHRTARPDVYIPPSCRDKVEQYWEASSTEGGEQE